jgi:hypothetical protein
VKESLSAVDLELFFFLEISVASIYCIDPYRSVEKRKSMSATGRDAGARHRQPVKEVFSASYTNAEFGKGLLGAMRYTYFQPDPALFAGPLGFKTIDKRFDFKQRVFGLEFALLVKPLFASSAAAFTGSIDTQMERTASFQVSLPTTLNMPSMR